MKQVKISKNSSYRSFMHNSTNLMFQLITKTNWITKCHSKQHFISTKAIWHSKPSYNIYIFTTICQRLHKFMSHITGHWNAINQAQTKSIVEHEFSESKCKIYLPLIMVGIRKAALSWPLRLKSCVRSLPELWEAISKITPGGFSVKTLRRLSQWYPKEM